MSRPQASAPALVSVTQWEPPRPPASRAGTVRTPACWLCTSHGGPWRHTPNPPCCPQVGEARALYNIGNVYHAKGKQLSWNAANATQDPGHLPPDVRETLCKASEFYE